jgi:hypothetical protein
MVRALDRAAEVTALGAGQLDFSDVPPRRLERLARTGLTANAAMLRHLPQVHRTATLLATVRALQVAAVDDALDLFAVLMATPLIGPAERASTTDQLPSLPALRKASATLAITAWMLLDLAGAAGDGPAVLDAGAWSQLRGAVPRERLAAAVATVTGLVPDADEDAHAGQRAELLKVYATVRPFLTMLAEVAPFAATDAGQPVLTAVGSLTELAARRRIRPEDVAQDVVGGSWRRLVFANPDLGAGPVDHRAYALCVLQALHRALHWALHRRDVYATGSARWNEPRAGLLDGGAWEQARPEVLTALRLTDPPETHLAELAGRLDTAYTDFAARLGPPEQRPTDAAVRLEPGPDGRVRLHLTRLGPVPEPASLVALRETVAQMLPPGGPARGTARGTSASSPTWPWPTASPAHRWRT